MIARLLAAAGFVFLLTTSPAGCGTDVDLGGSPDGGSVDAGPPGAQCAPCASGAECLSGNCGQFAGDLYCGTPCSASSPCATGDSCEEVISTAGASVHLCVPTNGVCLLAIAPPAEEDGAPLDHCASLNGPSIASPCEACGKYSNDCQANGCYGGYWCDEATRDCQPPPTTCP